VGLKLNWIHQLLGYADVNLLGNNIDTIRKNTVTLINASKKFGLEINVENAKYMLLSRHQNVGQNRDIKIARRSFENVSQFKYLGTTVTNRNLIQEKIKGGLNSGRACYHSVQNLLPLVCCQKLKSWYIQDDKFACGSVWVRILVSDIKLGT
jgi:hypothetical protein